MPTAYIVLFFAVAAATLVFSALKRTGARPREIFRIRETMMTVVLGVALWAESGALLYILLTMPERLGGGSAVLNGWLFAVASLLLGCFAVLFGSVKVVVACTDGFYAVTFYGSCTHILWEDVTDVQNVRKRLRFVTGSGRSATVGGSRQQMAQFVKLAAQNVPPEAGEDVLEMALRQKR